MKLVYKGIFSNNEQLPLGALPDNAVKFKEPKNLTETVIKSSLFSLPALAGVALFLGVSRLLHGELAYNGTVRGMLFAFLTLVPHEFLHAICFGKDAEVELFIAPKQLSLFVISTQPITKARYIFLSLLPNLVFGWLPLAVWAALPYSAFFSDHLLTFSVLAILFGVGDYMNSYNAARQMPKGSMQQLSGFNSYWFMPDQADQGDGSVDPQ
ncbi:MAG: DUF3267 domain-containing protein [Oscillospiraceae bacterium]|nr:DUF3267 domain-containing protein [Oscillospiraceae bacterium]